MLWPIVLPFKITFCIFAGLVAIVTIFAPAVKWKRGKTFAIASGIACIVFVPFCAGVMENIDSQRFGVFHYASFAEVKDPRVERYLPTNARNISLDKNMAGHRAKYSISEAELMEYLDRLWERQGKYSARPRDEMNQGAKVSVESVEVEYGDLGWPVLENAVELHSPVAGDGGGATYFFDRTTGTAYHHAGYW